MMIMMMKSTNETTSSFLAKCENSCGTSAVLLFNKGFHPNPNIKLNIISKLSFTKRLLKELHENCHC